VDFPRWARRKVRVAAARRRCPWRSCGRRYGPLRSGCRALLQPWPRSISSPLFRIPILRRSGKPIMPDGKGLGGIVAQAIRTCRFQGNESGTGKGTPIAVSRRRSRLVSRVCHRRAVPRTDVPSLGLQPVMWYRVSEERRRGALCRDGVCGYHRSRLWSSLTTEPSM
jgi:hypothetical protein